MDSHDDSGIVRGSGRSRKNSLFLNSSTKPEGFGKLMVSSKGVSC